MQFSVISTEGPAGTPPRTDRNGGWHDDPGPVSARGLAEKQRDTAAHTAHGATRFGAPHPRTQTDGVIFPAAEHSAWSACFQNINIRTPVFLKLFIALSCYFHLCVVVVRGKVSGTWAIMADGFFFFFFFPSLFFFFCLLLFLFSGVGYGEDGDPHSLSRTMLNFAAEDRAARGARNAAVAGRIRGNNERVVATHEAEARIAEDKERGRLEKKTRERLEHLERLKNC
jgi:hypothetical protein